jgi:UDP-N-acetylglucosamine--N-acetylmuramyl-(pentapeptide) pyrophosphoryl-undecaprenol N-acetylglucosamine transferase
MRIPTVIHEQNAFPGITNRILSRYVDKVCITFPEAQEHFYAKADIIETGLPVRTEILKADREEAYRYLGLASKKKTILVVGGSQGARSINRAVQPVLEWAAASRTLQMVVVAGKDKNQFACFSGINNIKIIPYLERMDLGLAVADLVISRAGASFLAEITAVGVPAILIPYPYASANHQEHNARSLERRGAARVLLEEEIDGDLLLEVVKSMFQPGVLQKMADNSRSMGKTQALSLITENILELVN